VPTDFPAGLPLPQASSVVGFGELSEELRYLELDVTWGAAALDTWLTQHWTGWQRTGKNWTRRGTGQKSGTGQNAVSTRITESASGSRLRIEYPAKIVRRG
jgi:hypothetical protein